ncbi:MAG: hypothetical protein ACLQU4_21855 [Limisphaerales bacterium]
MDWQKIASFVVVGVTAGAFVRAKLRKRKFSFERDTHCGCAVMPGRQESIVFQARKGERARIIVKSK